MTGRSWLKLNAAIAVCVVAVGCGPKEVEESLPAPKNDLETTFRWIPNDNVDLMSPEGTFLRAAAESWWRARAEPGGGMESITNGGYPGFDRVFNNVWPPEEVGGAGHFGTPIVGTEYLEAVDLRRDGVNFVGHYCQYSSMTATETPEGQYRGPRRIAAVAGRSMTFGPDPTLPPTAQKEPLAAQSGPADHPSENVFGTWVLTDSQGLDPDEIRCAETAPGTPPHMPNGYAGDRPPPTLPPSPGWPAG